MGGKLRPFRKRTKAARVRGSPRDDFSKTVRHLIAGQVGNLCSNQGCGAPTSGPSASRGFSNVGVGAHITGASSRGPRYDPKLTPAQRKSADNAIWLCQRCGKLVDDDTSTYSVHELHDWKTRAIERARRALETGKVLRPGPSKSTKNHGKRIFERSDQILSEASLISLTDRLLNDHSALLRALDPVDEWIDFFRLEGNQYLMPALRASAAAVRTALRALCAFIGVNFWLDGSGTRLVMHPALNVDRGGSGAPGETEAYDKFAGQLDEAAFAVRAAYVVYRRTIADQLHL